MGKALDKEKISTFIIEEIQRSKSTMSTKQLFELANLKDIKISVRSMQRIVNELCANGKLERFEKQIDKRKMVFWSVPLVEAPTLKTKKPGSEMKTEPIDNYIPHTETPPAIGRYRVVVERHDRGDILMFRGYKQRHVMNEAIDYLDEYYANFPRRKFTLILYDDLDDCRRILSETYKIGSKQKFNAGLRSVRTKRPISTNQVSDKTESCHRDDEKPILSMLNEITKTLARIESMLSGGKVGQKSETKTATKPKRTKKARKENVRQMVEQLITEGTHTPKGIKKKAMAKYPNKKSSYVSTLISRAKSRDHQAFSKLAKVDENGLMVWDI